MSLKLFWCFYCNPSFLLVLFTLLPYIHLSPIPVTETIYEQFIHDLTVQNCHIPSDINLPFIQCTESLECLSTAFKECNTNVSIKPEEKTFLLCAEIFDNLNKIFCHHDKMSDNSEIDRALSSRVCEGFNNLDAIPQNKQYLGSRLNDNIVCNVVCSKDFEFLCQILLWSYEVQAFGRGSNVKNLGQKKEHTSIKVLESTDKNQNFRPGDQQANPLADKQQQKDILINALEKKENAPKSLQLDNVGSEGNPVLKPKVVPKENLVKSKFEKLSNASPQQNDTIVVNDHISSENKKNDLINIIPVNEPNVEKEKNSLQIHGKPETGDDHLLNVKSIPNRISDHPEINDNLLDTDLNEKAKNLKSNQKDWKPDLDSYKLVTKLEPYNNELQTLSRTNNDNQDMQNKMEDDNGQNTYLENQPSNDKVDKLPETNSQFALNKSEIKVDQNAAKEGNNAIDLQISDTIDKGDVTNSIRGTNHQTDIGTKSTIIAEEKFLVTNGHVNSSEQQNFVGVTSKQNVKDAETDSNSLNIKTSNDNQFNQESTSIEAPLEKMDDSDVHPSPDQDQYNDVECNEGDVEGDYERSDYDVAVYQHTKGNEAESKVTNFADLPSETKNEIQKTFDEFPSKTSIVHGSEDVQMISSFPEQEDSHFIFYFLSIVLILMVGYVIFHNKQKIIALIVEGRHERRRRSHGVGYKKLETK